MGKGKKRRSVVWRLSGDVAHAFESPSATSICRSFSLTETTNVPREGEGPPTKVERCRSCEIALDQQW